MILDSHYYDNRDPGPEDGSGYVQVERVYCLDFDSFSDGDWENLAKAYKQLPEPMASTDIARWFGRDETHPPFLWASVEPAGLEVAGTLPLRNWLRWDTMFRTLLEGLPMFEV